MIEVISAISSLLCVYLTAKKNILCWPVGIIGAFGYMWIFYNNGQMANTGLQFVFLTQSIFAWWNWKSNKFLIPKNWIKKIAIGIVTLSFVMYIILLNSISNQPELDTITTCLSLIGMLLLIYKRHESWIFWIIADIFYIIMFAVDGELLLMSNYIILLGLSSWGLIKWKRENGRIENRW